MWSREFLCEEGSLMNSLIRKPLRLIDLETYKVGFQVIQSLDGLWSSCIHFFPDEDALSASSVKDGETVVEQVNDVDVIMIHGQDDFNEWEYAAESAIAVIEELGFQVNNKSHYFDVIFTETNEDSDIPKQRYERAICDGLDFKLIKKDGDSGTIPVNSH